LGYDIKQMDVLFLILGTMVVRLGSEPGEFQLKLLFSFMRLCVEAAKDFRWINHIRDVVKAFIDSPAGRTKDQLSNLLVLVGYLLVVPSHELGLDNDRVWKSFWSAFLGTHTHTRSPPRLADLSAWCGVCADSCDRFPLQRRR
jgi:hypothetical protein